jgi:hypothetical protein
LFPDLLGSDSNRSKKISVFSATSTHDAPDLLGSDSNRSKKTLRSKSFSDLGRIRIRCSRLRTRAPPLAGGPPFSTSTRTPTKSTSRAVLQLQASLEKDSEMRELPPVGRPPPLKTSRNPMATPNRFRAAI